VKNIQQPNTSKLTTILSYPVIRNKENTKPKNNSPEFNAAKPPLVFTAPNSLMTIWNFEGLIGEVTICYTPYHVFL